MQRRAATRGHGRAPWRTPTPADIAQATAPEAHAAPGGSRWRDRVDPLESQSSSTEADTGTLEPWIQILATAVSMTVSVAVAFGGLAGWFVRRLDRRFDAIDKRFDVIDQRFDVIDKRFDAVDRRFETIDGRFDAVDRRFDAVDRRFETMDGRFETIDRRFVAMDGRFETIDRRFDAMDARFEAVDRRFDAIDSRFEHLEGNVIGELRAEMQHGFEVAREERKRFDTRLDNLVRRTEELSDQIGGVRQSLGRLEGVLLGGPGLEPLPGARPG